jgi:hypothetical protein
MTVPIVPGPFSFLGEAGQALGNIGQVKEERKERAQKIAEHATTSILDAIMAGGDPAILDTPETQKILKTAGYPPITSSHFSFVGGAAAAAGAGGRARIGAGVPTKEAGAAATAADVQRRTGQAELDQNLPELGAEAKSYQARAAQAGAQFNIDVYKAAATRFADIKDPEFRSLAIDAATGVLDYRIRRLESNRYYLTMERQQLADRTRLLLESMRGQESMFKELNDHYEKQRRQDMFALNQDPNDEKATTRYESLHPRPTMADAQSAILESQGVSPDEFKQLMRQTYELQTAPLSTTGSQGASTGTDGQAGDATQPPFASSDLGEAYNYLQTAKDPDVAAQQFAEGVNTGHYSLAEAQLIFQEAKKRMSAAQYKKLRRTFLSKLQVPSGGVPPAIDPKDAP